MKKVLSLFLIAVCMFSLSTSVFADTESFNSKYGDIQIKRIFVDNEKNELVIKSEVSAYKTKQRYFVETYLYKFENYKLNEVASKSNFEGFGKCYGKVITNSFSLEELSKLENGTYAIDVYLHDYDGYLAQNKEHYTACFASTSYIFKTINIFDGKINISNYSCKQNGHLFTKWIVNLEPSAKKDGELYRECLKCYRMETDVIESSPTVSRSGYSIEIGKNHYYYLDVSRFVYGDDPIKKVIIKSKKIAEANTVKDSDIIKIRAKKYGKTKIVVRLKKGTLFEDGNNTIAFTINVVKDSFSYKIKNLSYSTRNKVFTVKLKNTSANKAKIYAKDAILMDWDYKSFDRKVIKVNGKDFVVVKPGNIVKLAFKHSGTSAWPGYEKKTIKFKVAINGEKEWVKISEKNW